MRSPRRFVLPVIAGAATVVLFWGPGLDGAPTADRAGTESRPSTPADTDTDPGTDDAGQPPEASEAQDTKPAPTDHEPAWDLPARNLVSAPVLAGDKIVVYAAARGRLRLLVIDPETGAVLDRRPSSSSYVLPGVTMEVTVRGDLVYHYAPTPRLQQARLEVYDARQTRVVARSAPAYFWSLPTGCTGRGTDPVCVSAGDAAPASVYHVDADTGRLRLAAADVGRGLDAGLYNADGRISLVRSGDPIWQRPAPALAGGLDVTPDEGWDWHQQGRLLIGSFGTEELRTDNAWIKRPGRIARIDPASGRPVWVRRGTAYCELDLMEPAADGPRRWFRCATTGRAPSTGSGTYDLSAWKTAITRFDPRTGAALWTTKPADWDPVYEDSTWVKLSDSLVAGRRNGRLVTLDVTSGQVTKADPSTVGWCAQQRSYQDRDAADFPQTRIARGLASPCQADGRPVDTPAFVDPTFGVEVDDLFVWASKTGLHATRTD